MSVPPSASDRFTGADGDASRSGANTTATNAANQLMSALVHHLQSGRQGSSQQVSSNSQNRMGAKINSSICGSNAKDALPGFSGAANSVQGGEGMQIPICGIDDILTFTQCDPCSIHASCIAEADVGQLPGRELHRPHPAGPRTPGRRLQTMQLQEGKVLEAVLRVLLSR